ncbi:MAG: hypothetical protein ACU0AU_13980 [Cognatishimia activa]
MPEDDETRWYHIAGMLLAAFVVMIVIKNLTSGPRGEPYYLNASKTACYEDFIFYEALRLYRAGDRGYIDEAVRDQDCFVLERGRLVFVIEDRVESQTVRAKVAGRHEYEPTEPMTMTAKGLVPAKVWQARENNR